VAAAEDYYPPRSGASSVEVGVGVGVLVPDPAIAKPITIKRAKINRNCLLLPPKPKPKPKPNPNLSRSPPEIRPIHLHLRLQFADDLRLRFFLLLWVTKKPTWLVDPQVAVPEGQRSADQTGSKRLSIFNYRCGECAAK